jgi:hypothetical protein
VFKNRVLSRIFEPSKNEMAASCRKLHKEERRNLCCSPNIIRMMKPKEVEMDAMCSAHREMRNLEDLGVNGKIILK